MCVFWVFIVLFLVLLVYFSERKRTQEFGGEGGRADLGGIVGGKSILSEYYKNILTENVLFNQNI